jgi:hypothetical protein
VLTAAYQVLLKNMTDEMMDREDFAILDPEFSAFSASTPLLLSAATLEAEIAHAMNFARELIGGKAERKGCIAICGFSLYELAKFGQSVGLPVLDGTTDIDTYDLFLSDLEQTKGFEFDVVCVLNCRSGVLPSASAPDSERYRDLARLYVAMTRAKTDLVLSWSGEPSPFLVGASEHFLSDAWAAYTATADLEYCGAPRRLAEHRPEAIENKSWKNMSGPEFLYSQNALGLSPELIAKLRLLVDGAGLRKGREYLRWGTLETASRDYRKSGRVRRIWGPEVGRQFDELVKQLDSKERVRSRIALAAKSTNGTDTELTVV